MKRAARWALPLLPLIAIALVIESYGQAEKKEGGAVNRILGRKSGKAEPPPPAEAKQPAAVPAESAPAENAGSEVVEPRVVPVGDPAESAAPEPVSTSEEPESATGFMAKEGGQVKIDLGSEADESSTSVRNIFVDDAEIKKKFEDAAFIYEADGIADPMIFPPIRNEAIRNEMWLKMETTLKDAGGDPTDGNTNQGIDPEAVKKAIEALQKIVDLNDSRFNEESDAKIQALKPYLPGGRPGPGLDGEEKGPGPGVPKPLPKELELGPKGVVYNTDGTATCLLGDRLVKKGEVVPDFDYVRVTDIQANKIVLQCFTPGGATEDHEVEVNDFTNFSFWDSK